VTVADLPTTALSTLTEAQRAAFREYGYLVFERVLSSDDLADVRAASERLQSERRRRGGDDRLAIINNVAFMDHVFLRLARHPFMLGVVSDLIGPNLRLQHAKLNWKPPTVGAGEVGWHQDYPFFPHTNYDLVACMFVLDDATPDNGCMRVIPGSHLRGPVDHYQADGSFAGRCTDPLDFEPHEQSGNVVDFIVPAGSMTVHHCTAIHSSYPNRSTTPRRGLVYQIASGDAVQLSAQLVKVWGMWLQGEDPLRARFLDGTTQRLPGPAPTATDVPQA